MHYCGWCSVLNNGPRYHSKLLILVKIILVFFFLNKADYHFCLRRTLIQCLQSIVFVKLCSFLADTGRAQCSATVSIKNYIEIFALHFVDFIMFHETEYKKSFIFFHLHLKWIARKFIREIIVRKNFNIDRVILSIKKPVKKKRIIAIKSVIKCLYIRMFLFVILKCVSSQKKTQNLQMTVLL